MKNPKFYSCMLFLLGVSTAVAQQSTVISGGNAIGGTGNVSYSIGQIDFASAAGSGGSISQGVQQPFEIVTLSNAELTNVQLEMKVYPNPTASVLYLKIENMDLKNLSYQLYDMSGRSLRNQAIKQTETQIDCNALPSSVYILNIVQDSKTIKSFKVIKK